MFRTLTILATIGVAVPFFGSAGCTSRGHVSVTGPHVPGPQLVYLGPGLWVVADYHDPLFYSDGYYWLYDRGVWYRSASFRGSFVRVHARVVPTPVRHIDRPHLYVRYHPPRNARVRTGPPPGKARVRDHRSPEPPPKTRDHRSPEPPPKTRDHRSPEPPPKTRDHRSPEPPPKARDHRSPEPPPKARDHRSPEPPPKTRDHRED